jgi:hypothetical protein
VVCPLVLIELLLRLVKPEPKHFGKDVESFSFLTNNCQKFLPFPGEFTLKTVLQVPDSPVAAMDEADFEQWAELVLKAASREALTNGDVELGTTLISYGVDLGKVESQQENGRRAFAARITELRELKHPLTRHEFGAGFLSSQGILPKVGDIESIGAALDAACQYQNSLVRTGADYNLLAERHRGDWIDSQLLYYLSDAEMHIVTNDKQLKGRCKSSAQSQRVILI